MAKIQKSWGCSIESLKLFEDKCETFETINSTFAYKLTAPTARPPPQRTLVVSRTMYWWASNLQSVQWWSSHRPTDMHSAYSLEFYRLWLKKKAQVITTCSYTHSCKHLPKDYWNETNDLNNNNCENRKKEEKKHFCFGGANRNAYVLNTSMNWALPSGSSGT